MKINLKYLRTQHPEFKWTAERIGFGYYRYKGVKGEQRFELQSYALLDKGSVVVVHKFSPKGYLESHYPYDFFSLG